MASRKSPELTEFFENPIGHIRDRIIINPSPEIPKAGQFISLNGFAFQIVPGKEIDLPRPVRLMLDTRIKTETYQEGDQTFTQDIPRFTYTLIKAGINLDADGKVLTPAELAEREKAATKAAEVDNF
jgi:hypothetical protein